MKVTGVPTGTLEALAVSLKLVAGLMTMTVAEAVSVGAAFPSTVSVPVAVALSVTVFTLVVVLVRVSVHVNVQVAPTSKTVVTPSELLLKVAAPQLDPVTLTPLNLSDPVFVSS